MRDKVETQSILLRSEAQMAHLQAKLKCLPFDIEHPIEVVIREEVKKRKMSLNDRMWAGPLKDIERDAIVKSTGCRYNADFWHLYFKRRFLPDDTGPDFDPSHVLDGYHKWTVDPWSGERILTGSTTRLTNKGMRIYLLKMESEASQEYGVTFTEPNERWAA